ncbi:hypothetical protein COL5a_005739 [Colletotrichum fioriniae]|nr:hypothetical protein COL5a_005739 [Colletotrichum fioriniae]
MKDLKQQKFTLDVEPTDPVRPHPHFRLRDGPSTAALRCPTSKTDEINRSRLSSRRLLERRDGTPRTRSLSTLVGNPTPPKGRRWLRLTATLGKILKDDDTVESYKIEEKGFVVCMVNKVRSPTTIPALARVYPTDDSTAQGTQARSGRRVLVCACRPRHARSTCRRHARRSSRSRCPGCCPGRGSRYADSGC